MSSLNRLVERAIADAKAATRSELFPGEKFEQLVSLYDHCPRWLSRPGFRSFWQRRIRLALGFALNARQLGGGSQKMPTCAYCVMLATLVCDHVVDGSAAHRQGKAPLRRVLRRRRQAAVR